MKIETHVISGNSLERYREDWWKYNLVLEQRMIPESDCFSRTLRPRYYSEVKRNGSAWFQFQNTLDMTFELLLDGVLNYEQDGIQTKVAPGEFYRIRPGSTCTFTADRKDHFHRLRLMFRGNLLAALDWELMPRAVHVTKPSSSEDWADRFRRMGERMAGNASNRELSAETYQFIVDAAAEFSRAGERHPPEALAHLARSMRENPEGTFDSETLSRTTGMEIHHLMRLFKEYFAVSPHEYLTGLRLEKARRLMSSPALSLKEISGACGFSNSLYFSTVFRKRFGESPTGFRKKCRGLSQD